MKGQGIRDTGLALMYLFDEAVQRIEVFAYGMLHEALEVVSLADVALISLVSMGNWTLNKPSPE